MEIKNDISKEASYSVAVVNGELELKVIYKGKFAGASVAIQMSAVEFLEKFVEATPNKLDDAAVAMLKAAL